MQWLTEPIENSISTRAYDNVILDVQCSTAAKSSICKSAHTAMVAQENIDQQMLAQDAGAGGQLVSSFDPCAFVAL